MRTRRQYLVETLGGGRIDVVADETAGAVAIELRHGQPGTLLTAEQAADLVAAVEQALLDLAPETMLHRLFRGE